MKVVLAAIGERARPAFEELAKMYAGRMEAYAEVEVTGYRSEEAFLEAMERQRGRTAPVVVLLDGRGRQMSSEQLAEWLGRQRDEGQQRMIFAVGPANGWSDEARKRAGALLSLGSMTLAHELARVVLCEQVYRAFTILAGHPYHRGS
ncbi:23S rRNA (pseudouridine(1915)-N(3))-methyltransferase RlmH [Paracidobacterium acidisoli]|uniref:Ribosomal RNA large subunit methyltransferase H n=1 Tax=Paracidobacterium acidisoli TaxID=2303751 RepID=A0A372INK6_9BACT|nr:23S rRNA (pseudouridine(1915)-N(3))-methyltransferase RlmH [Paracidobacterium acidisoli]MBT9331854.1 23S rRNA (pseudouridine(1915)-N(3))-methyltransferase RlmH [Paracidobacterium acidisoli]